MMTIRQPTNVQEATPVDRLSALPRELRDQIYGYLVLPPLGIRIRYPPRSTDAKMLVSPLSHVSGLIRRESWPIVYQNSRRFAHHGSPVEGAARFQVHKLQKRARATPLLSLVKLTFQMNADKRYRMTGIAVLHGPYGNRGIVSRFMEAKTDEFKEIMFAVLDTNRALRARLVEEAYSPYLDFAPRLSEFVLGAF
ncbi:hypothetical protein TI39_contig337g00017 [Zymoseptoria brevis]|uniref:F-box domain-containing protein n=1 Tax=Zymoseptoria brevis TaxID=1047168 RepID=A0A0F4GS45_9PEZI|nr:hypothetical protein TI39_contig337g00017 [Zymoseptoria brevis]